MAKVRRDAGCGNPKKLVFCPWRATNLFAAAVRTQLIKTLYPHKLVLSCDGFHRIFALQMLRMFKKMNKLILFLFATMVLSLSTYAQSRLTVGGYGEVALTRNFYSDNVYRYSSASAHAGESHGRFDIPHAVIYLGYDFGKGWTMQSEIEFEHTGTGVATEREFEEAGEWEKEVEKGGEVELEQFWIQKAFLPQLNVRMGHIVVPVGGLNNAHEPLNFFTVYRPEGESTILPSTWHDTGISIWGQAGAWRYEAQFLAGLDALMFTRDNWIKNGPKSAFEYKVANQYGAALRIDNTSVRNLRLSLSGYAGNSMRNTYPNEALSERYDVKGTVLVGAFDFAYTGQRLVVRGNADYGSLSDAAVISRYKAGKAAGDSPYSSTPVGGAAYAVGLEAGYDILPWLQPRDREQKLCVFGRYEAYDPYVPSEGQADFSYTAKQRIAFGLNWFPVPQIAVKAEWSYRFLSSQYNNEPSVSIGVAYMGFFKR